MRRPAPFSPAALVGALMFGGVAAAIVVAGVIVPLPGTAGSIDPRETIVTLGAALTGPIGGLIIGVLAGVADPAGAGPSVVGHVAGGLWLGFAYRRILHEHLRMPAALVVWVLFVLAYYYVFLIPGLVVGGMLFGGVPLSGVTAPLAAYVALGRAALPSAVFTTIVTSAILAALPRDFRRPLW